MHESSTLPAQFTAAQRHQVEIILAKSEVALISCLFWQMDIRDVIPRRRLADSLLYVPVTGHLHCRVGTREQVLGPGDVLLVGEGVEHEAWLAPDCAYFEAYALHAHAYTTHGRPLFEVFASPFGRCQPPAAWWEQMQVLTHLMGQNPVLGRQYGEPWLRSLLLHQVLQGNPVKEQPAMDDPRMWQAVYHILNHYAEPLAVPPLAQLAGVSERQFRSLFRHYTGLTPKAYIQQLRLRKARALLQTNPLLTVKEVARQTGFGDPHYLHAVFKQVYGTSPAACRQPGRSDA